MFLLIAFLIGYTKGWTAGWCDGLSISLGDLKSRVFGNRFISSVIFRTTRKYGSDLYMFENRFPKNEEEI